MATTGSPTKMPLPSLLSLTGYRATGKTTVARLVAEQLGWDWVDTDRQIEESAGKTIADLFATEGEPHFRDLEEQALAALIRRKELVLALGGGAILSEATRRRLMAAGPVVWLTASAETLTQRIAKDNSASVLRPSLTSLSPLEEVRQVLAERTPLYQECATLACDTESQTPEQVAEAIARWFVDLSPTA